MLWSQYDETIALRNPSFEGLPHKGGDLETDFSSMGVSKCWYYFYNGDFKNKPEGLEEDLDLD